MIKKPIIGITMGDPAGIGPEIILKVCKDENTYDYCTPIIIGSLPVFQCYKKLLGYDLNLIETDALSKVAPSPKDLYILPLSHQITDINPGTPTKECGMTSGEAIIKAVELASNGKIDAFTTAPISKEILNLAGYKYAGHTEMIADLTGTKNAVMMLTGGDLRVVLVTTHVAINWLTPLIKKEKIFDTLQIINKSMYLFGIKNPKIAVSALNPHAGEGGLFGREEIEIISPAINDARKNGIDAEGPFSADTLFVYENRKKFDAILVMYHDQGLIPLKMSSFGKGVNVTLGLPLIRTSVDHGTAYKIAGKGIAEHSSMIEALKLASFMSANKIS